MSSYHPCPPARRERFSFHCASFLRSRALWVAQVLQETTAVELGVDVLDLASRGDVEAVNALDLDGIVTGTLGGDPAPVDSVAGVEVVEGVDEERWLGAGALDESIDTSEGGRAQLESEC